MSILRNRILMLVTLILSVLPVISLALGAETSNKEFCYSAYHLQQQLDMSVNFGQTVQQQKTRVDVDIHVREIPASSRDLSLVYDKGDSGRNIRSFVVLVSPNTSKVNGVEMDMSQRYRHPFLVLVDGDSGELIDLKSTVQEQVIINEYLSFFDLFQYSESNGEYHYRNGNGRYQARINNSENDPGQLTKRNVGYLKTDDENSNELQLLESYLSITLAESESECFYQKGHGVEVFKTTLSTKAFVDGDAKIAIESDLKRALPSTHFFYTLTDDLATWPGFNVVETITSEHAFARLSILMEQLSSLTQDDSQFLKAMLLEKATWPYLAEYILENGVSNELSLELFWGLDKIDTSESVNSLAVLATSPLSDRDLFRAVMALGSTSASFDQDSIVLLQNHMANFTSPEFAQPEKLTFIRMLGAMASRRSTTDPLQSSELRSFLYSQVGGYDESVNAAVIDAIGNLKDSIDIEGEDILLRELSADSEKVRLSSVSAFKRVPYKSEHSDVFIDQLANESNLEIKNSIVEVLGRTDNTDLKVKHQLLILLDNSDNAKLKNKSLASLKKVDYVFQSDDIHLLESRLRKETDRANQRLLASLILKHRRKQ